MSWSTNFRCYVITSGSQSFHNLSGPHFENMKHKPFFEFKFNYGLLGGIGSMSGIL